jgi:hypothetical protein
MPKKGKGAYRIGTGTRYDKPKKSKKAGRATRIARGY